MSALKGKIVSEYDTIEILLIPATQISYPKLRICLPVLNYARVDSHLRAHIKKKKKKKKTFISFKSTKVHGNKINVISTCINILQNNASIVKFYTIIQRKVNQ